MTIKNEQLVNRIKKGFNWIKTRLTEQAVTALTLRARDNCAEKLSWLCHVQNWPKVRQIQQVSKYQKQWGKWYKEHRGVAPDNFRIIALMSKFLFSVIYLFGFTASVMAAPPTWSYKVGDGVAWVGDLASGSYSAPNESCQPYQIGFLLWGGPVYGNHIWKSIDGYEGIEIAPGVIYGFRGTITQSSGLLINVLRRNGDTADSLTINFNTNGSYSSTFPLYNFPPANNLWMISLVPVGTLQNDPSTRSAGPSSWSLRPFFYISPSAIPGSYNVPSSSLNAACTNYSATFHNGGTLTITDVPPRLCNINISPTQIAVTLLQNNQSPSTGGAININGQCTGGGAIPTTGQVKLSILADNPISSNNGGAGSALALLNSTNKKVGSVNFSNSALSPNNLSVTGNPYNVPVQWSNFNFNINYTILGLGSSDTPAFGIGRGTAKFVVEWP